MKVNNYPVKTPASGDRLFGSDSNGDQKQFDIADFAAPTYKKYVALLNQSGTTAPVATILENTLGDIVWSYEEVGYYIGTLQGAFSDISKVFLPSVLFYGGAFSLGVPNDKLAQAEVDSDDAISIETTIQGVSVNGYLQNTPIEIRVYN